MIRINNPHATKETYVSKMTYYGSHYEIVLHTAGRDISIVFGRRKHGYFVYFPVYEEGVNVSPHQWGLEAIDKISYMFDEYTSAVIAGVVEQLLDMEGGRKWYGERSEKSKRAQSRQVGVPF